MFSLFWRIRIAMHVTRVVYHQHGSTTNMAAITPPHPATPDLALVRAGRADLTHACCSHPIHVCPWFVGWFPGPPRIVRQAKEQR